MLSEPFTAYLSGQPCAIYRWSIEEEWERWETETYTDKDGRTRTRRVLRSGWTTVADGGESSGFYIQDETGYVWVRPKGAEIELLSLFSTSACRGEALYHEKGPSEAIDDSTGRRRYFERGMPIGTRLFVRGRARERTDIVAAEIAEDPRAEMFIISPRKESDLSAGREGAYWTWCVLGGLLAVVATCLLAGAEVGFRGAAAWWGGFAYLLAWIAGWVWMVYNSLVSLRLRVQQAWSLIDVQLKRRADLIPRWWAASRVSRPRGAAADGDRRAPRPGRRRRPSAGPHADLAGAGRGLSGAAGAGVLRRAPAQPRGDRAAHRASAELLQRQRHLP